MISYVIVRQREINAREIHICEHNPENVGGSETKSGIYGGQLC